MTPQDQEHKSEWSGIERLVPAIVLIAVGTIFFLSNMHFLPIREVLRYWPAILVAVGIMLLVDSKERSSHVAGGVFTAVGAFLLARNLGFIDISWREGWPLLLIGLGLLMLWDRAFLHVGVVSTGMDGRRRFRFGHRVPKESVVFSSTSRSYYGQEFLGGRYESVFGGFEIDLRGSHMADDEAIVKIEAVFGGAEVKVPDTWLVVIKATAVFGAVINNTKAPDPVLVPNPKRLIVKGSAVFGGIEIKN